jgi:hypothetical protein
MHLVPFGHITGLNRCSLALINMQCMHIHFAILPTLTNKSGITTLILGSTKHVRDSSVYCAVN